MAGRQKHRIRGKHQLSTLPRRRTYFECLRDGLSKEGRRYFSVWRAWQIWKSAVEAEGLDSVRWSVTPETHEEVENVLRRLRKFGQVQLVEGAHGLYELLPLQDSSLVPNVVEAVTEMNPSAVYAYASAAEVLGLSNRFSRALHFAFLSHEEGEESGRLRAPRSTPKELWGTEIVWHVEDSRRLVWSTLRQLPLGGPPVAVVTRERCLVDALHRPALFGGWAESMSIWEEGHHYVDMDSIVAYAEAVDSAVLRQRVGYISESLGLTHRVFDQWAERAKAGGSAVLDAKEPWKGGRCERWKLGLNAHVPWVTELGDDNE